MQMPSFSLVKTVAPILCALAMVACGPPDEANRAVTGPVHGPFIVWGTLNGEAAGNSHHTWKELRQRLPKRFEGAYRHGRRHGEFVYRDRSGQVVSHCYQEGELVT